MRNDVRSLALSLLAVLPACGSSASDSVDESNATDAAVHPNGNDASAADASASSVSSDAGAETDTGDSSTEATAPAVDAGADAETAGNEGGTASDAGSPLPALGELLAFPTAEGYGRFSKGGRGGRVIEVTNLNDSGPGSLRAAVTATGPRTVVFTIGGAINLASRIAIDGTMGELTIAGQTAPGKGIQVRNYALGMIGGSDVIIRFMRVGVGGASMQAMDGMGMRSANNTIYDHCSINWTIDEGFSSRSAYNLTLQRTMISECLNESYHYNDTTTNHTGTQAHSFAGSISGSIGSFHHNLLAHCTGRNWSLAGGISKDGKHMTGDLDIRNNVVYNWLDRTTDGQNHTLNFVNNYYKPGPVSKHFLAIDLQYYSWVPDEASWYISGNVMPGHIAATDTGSKVYDWVQNTAQPTWVKSAPLFESYVTTESAADAYTNVLANVGANVPSLDEHDTRIIKEVKNGTYTYKGSVTGLHGIIDSETDAGGFESFPTVSRPAGFDSDHDGMPDTWEKAHGLNPSDASDGNETTLSPIGYTNLEMYLNELAGDYK
jgi:hypothetical protein